MLYATPQCQLFVTQQQQHYQVLHALADSDLGGALRQCSHVAWAAHLEEAKANALTSQVEQPCGC